MENRNTREKVVQKSKLSKPGRRRQRERGETKGLMSKTMALHVCFRTLYIS